MDTLLIKINKPEKVSMLVEVLKSLDFVISVDHFDNLKKVRQLFEEVNEIASETELSKLSMEDIIAEIKTHRIEKKSGSN